MRSPYVPAPRRWPLNAELLESKDVVGSMLDATILSVGNLDLFHVGDWRTFDPAIFRVIGSEEATNNPAVNDLPLIDAQPITPGEDTGRSLVQQAGPTPEYGRSSPNNLTFGLPSAELNLAGDFSATSPPEQAPPPTVLRPTGMAPSGPASETAVGSGGPVLFTRSSVGADGPAAAPVAVPDSQPQFQGTFTARATSSDTGKKGKDPNSSGPLDPFTPPWVSLTVDGLTASQNDNPGGLVVDRADSNNAPRKKITISAGPANMVTGVTPGPTHLELLTG